MFLNIRPGTILTTKHGDALPSNEQAGARVTALVQPAGEEKS